MAELREIELIRVQDDGRGYAVLHLDDDTSIGQNFHDAPVSDADAMKEFLTAVAEEVLARRAPRPTAVQAVKDLVGQRVAPMRPRFNGARA
jgi:hypothetical protein